MCSLVKLNVEGLARIVILFFPVLGLVVFVCDRTPVELLIEIGAMVKDMKARDKVIVMAFVVCGAFLLGDHLSFTAYFQPTLIVPVLMGELVAGVFAVIFAQLLAVKKAEQLEALDLEN